MKTPAEKEVERLEQQDRPSLDEYDRALQARHWESLTPEEQSARVLLQLEVEKRAFTVPLRESLHFQRKAFMEYNSYRRKKLFQWLGPHDNYLRSIIEKRRATMKALAQLERKK